jgi:hypothetical protein
MEKMKAAAQRHRPKAPQVVQQNKHLDRSLTKPRPMASIDNTKGALIDNTNQASLVGSCRPASIGVGGTPNMENQMSSVNPTPESWRMSARMSDAHDGDVQENFNLDTARSEPPITTSGSLTQTAYQPDNGGFLIEDLEFS